MFVCCECCVLSGRGLWDGLMTCPEESYRLWCVVVCDQETSRGGRGPRWVAAPRVGRYMISTGYRILLRRPEENKPLWQPRRKREDNIKIYLQDLGWGMDWIDVAPDRGRFLSLVNPVMNLRVP